MSNFGIPATVVVVVVMSALMPLMEGADANRPIQVSLTSADEHLMLAISGDGSYWLSAKPIALTDLRTTLSDLSWHPGVPALINARDASFGAVMAGMDAMRAIGIREVGLVTHSYRPREDVHSRLIAIRVFLADRKP